MISPTFKPSFPGFGRFSWGRDEFSPDPFSPAIWRRASPSRYKLCCSVYNKNSLFHGISPANTWYQRATFGGFNMQTSRYNQPHNNHKGLQLEHFGVFATFNQQQGFQSPRVGFQKDSQRVVPLRTWQVTTALRKDRTVSSLLPSLQQKDLLSLVKACVQVLPS